MNSTAWASRLPWGIVVLATMLVGIGWAGIGRSQEISAVGEGFLRRQIQWSIVAATAMVLITLLNYRVLIRYSYSIFAVCLALLVLVYFTVPVNGAHRWIRLGPLSLQPSELAKPALVLCLARWLMYRDSYRRLDGLLIPLGFVLVPVLLVLKEPDLGSSLVFLPVMFAMLFAAGARLRHLAALLLVATAMLPLLWSQMSREQKSRITALAEQASAEQQPSDDSYHLYQAKRMIALGGVQGSFVLGDDIADRAGCTVPEPHTDSIFSILAERFGLWGIAALLALFVLLVWRILAVAQKTHEPYGRLVAVGVAAMLSVQVLINTGMMVGLVPITGLTLPLVSYGGSSLLANALALGLVLNIALRPGFEIAKEPFRFAVAHSASAS